MALDPRGEATFLALVQGAPDPIAIEAEGRLLYANPAMAEYLGYAGAADLMCVPAAELVSRHGWPAEFSRPDADAPANASGREARLTTCAGSFVFVEWRAEPLDFGARPATALFLRDVTGRVHALQALRRSEQNFRTIIERAPVAMCVCSYDRMLYVNRVLLDYLGYSSEDGMFGPTLAELSDVLIHPDDRDRTRAAFQKLFAEMKSPERPDHDDIVRIDDVRVRRKLDGALRYCDIHGVLVMRDGAPVLVTTLHDQTERRTTADRMRLADRMSSLGTLAAGIAHEINNPLTYVFGNIDLIVRSLAREACAPALAPALYNVRTGLDRIRKIVRALKTFSRADEETIDAVDVVRVVESCIDMAQNQLRHKGRLTRDYSASPHVRGNEARIAQVLLNLLVNAADALDEARGERNEVRVRVAEAHGRACIEVRDNGRGIEPDDLARIFDPFFTTKPVGVGTGLGLFVCHEIVSALGGEIAVESQFGAGTSVSVRLPLAAQPGAGVAGEAPALPRRQARILLVDDEPLLLDAAREILEAEHEVRACSSGAEALSRVVAGERFDLVLCDLMMPGLTGTELYERIARASPAAARKMTFMTGGAVTETAQKQLDRTLCPCIEKPFDSEELLAFVRAHLA